MISLRGGPYLKGLCEYLAGVFFPNCSLGVFLALVFVRVFGLVVVWPVRAQGFFLFCAGVWGPSTGLKGVRLCILLTYLLGILLFGELGLPLGKVPFFYALFEKFLEA